jgi:hypothetical protein
MFIGNTKLQSKKGNPKRLAQVVKALILEVYSIQGPRFNTS